MKKMLDVGYKVYYDKYSKRFKIDKYETVVNSFSRSDILEIWFSDRDDGIEMMNTWNASLKTRCNRNKIKICSKCKCAIYNNEPVKKKFFIFKQKYICSLCRPASE